MRRRLTALAVCAAVIVAAACSGDAVTVAPPPPPPAPMHPAPGASGAGDAYYPDDGNRGYETPRDKATFTLTAHVPPGWTVISNGREGPPGTWTEPNPIASYLTTIAIDKFAIDKSTLPDGTPVVSAYAPGVEARRAIGDRLPEVLGFLSGKFGPYPQSAAGGIFLNEDVHFSLETQTRPTYAKWADLPTLV